MPDLDEVVIVDVSKWQGMPDWVSMRPLIHGAYIKASDGASPLGKDPRFDRNKAELTRLKIPWGAYHFFKANKDPRKQAQVFASFIGHYNSQGFYELDCQLKPVVDMEYRPFLSSKQAMINSLQKFVNEFKAITGIDIMIYTRATWWDVNMPRTDLDNAHWLWVAHYNSAITEPNVPLDWKNRGWKMWQWSADKNGRGKEFFVQSKDIDIDRYNGGLAQLKKDYPNVDFGVAVYPTPDPEPEPTPEPQPEPETQEIEIAKVLYTGLRVRDAIIPSAKYGPVRGKTYGTSHVYFSLPADEPVEVLEKIQDGVNLWYRIGKRQFVAREYDGKVYLS